MAMYVTLSSAGASPALACTGLAKTTMVQVTQSSNTATIDFTIQCTMDDLARTPSPSWSNISTTHYSTAYQIDGITVTLLSPVAGVRLSSTGWSAGPATLKMLQS